MLLACCQLVAHPVGKPTLHPNYHLEIIFILMKALQL